MAKLVSGWSTPIIWVVGEKGYRIEFPVEYEARLFSDFRWPQEEPTHIYCENGVEPDETSICLVSVRTKGRERYRMVAGKHMKLTRRTKLMGTCAFSWVTPVLRGDGSVNYDHERRLTKLRPRTEGSATDSRPE